MAAGGGGGGGYEFLSSSAASLTSLTSERSKQVRDMSIRR